MPASTLNLTLNPLVCAFGQQPHHKHSVWMSLGVLLVWQQNPMLQSSNEKVGKVLLCCASERFCGSDLRSVSWPWDASRCASARTRGVSTPSAQATTAALWSSVQNASCSTAGLAQCAERKRVQCTQHNFSLWHCRARGMGEMVC
jgi:hypothetical protein